MTREEALRYNQTFSFEEMDNVIIEIYNDFESRTCENCKYNYVLHGNINYCSLLEQDKMKYCSEFVSTDTKGEEDD